jgi:polysaccharide chain length determinant protein (PEP-CTERM system associated)
MDQALDQLLEQLRRIWSRRFWGLVTAWLVGAVGLAAAFLLPARYEATAKVFVDSESVLKPLMAGLAVQPNTDQEIAVLSRTLTSRPNMEKLVRAAHLDYEVKTEADREVLMERTAKSIKVGDWKENTLSVAYRDTDPVRAKRVVDYLLALFEEVTVTSKRSDTDRAQQFLSAQITSYEKLLSEAERRLKEFKLQNMEDLASTQDAVGNMIVLESEVEKVRTDLRAAEQRRDALQRQLDGEQAVFPLAADESGGSPDADAEISSRADAMRRNLDDLLRKYTDEHPSVISTRRVLADLERQRQAAMAARERELAAEVREREIVGRPPGVVPRVQQNPVYQQLKLAIAEADGNVAALRARLGELERRYQRTKSSAKLKPELEEQLAQLNREYQIQKTSFEQLVSRRESAKMTGELDESAGVRFRVVDPARVPVKPVGPTRLALVCWAMLASLAAGVAGSYMASQLFPTIATAKELQVVTGMAVVGSITFWPTPDVTRARRHRSYLFFAGATSLCAVFCLALVAIITSVHPI